MNLPTYIQNSNQENYNEELSQTLIQNLSDNGYVIPTLTNAQLTVNPFVLPTGVVTTVALGMPDGTIWYISDGAPADFVVKRSGALRRLVTAAYP